MSSSYPYQIQSSEPQTIDLPKNQPNTFDLECCYRTAKTPLFFCLTISLRKPVHRNCFFFLGGGGVTNNHHLFFFLFSYHIKPSSIFHLCFSSRNTKKLHWCTLQRFRCMFDGFQSQLNLFGPFLCVNLFHRCVFFFKIKEKQLCAISG